MRINPIAVRRPPLATGDTVIVRHARSEADLRRASDHLYYEIWMFNALANGLASGIVGEGPLSNAVLEAITVHTRILLDFLYAEKPQSDDVIAEDFFADPDIWANERPVKSELLAGVHRRVAKEVAHLTYARLDVTPDAKPWRFLHGLGGGCSACQVPDHRSVGSSRSQVGRRQAPTWRISHLPTRWSRPEPVPKMATRLGQAICRRVWWGEPSASGRRKTEDAGSLERNRDHA